MKYIESKIKYLPTFTCLIVEMGVSGYFTPIDGFWIFTRVGLVLVFVSLVIADQIKTIQWLPLALIALSLMSIRDKWQAIEKEKLTSVKSDYVTKVKPPEKPVLADCKDLTKRRKSECDSNNKELQLTYNKALEKYNSRVITTETKSENTKVELDFYDQQPIWIYVFLTCVMSFLTLISTPEEKKEIKTDKKDLRARVIARIEGGMSNLQISTELGIDRREVAKIKSSLVQSRPVNVQSMSNVINLDERKKA